MKNNNSQKDALLVQLRRVEDDIERLSSLDPTAEISSALDALISEAKELELGISRLLGEKTRQEKIKEVRSLRYKGLSFEEIGARTGIARSAAQRYCHDIPVDRRQFAKPRLTPPDWLDAARSKAAEGKSRHVIAKELGIPLAKFYRAFNRFASV